MKAVAADPSLAGIHWAADGIGRLTFDRPDVLNALDAPMLERACYLLDAVGRDPSVRVVVLTGRGRAFCSGADLGSASATDEGRTDPTELNLVARFVLALRRLPKPVVARVHGPAAGVGCSIALACDLIYASQQAYFLLAFAKVGLMPDGGATLVLPELIGRVKATEMALLAERMSADTAAEWGLVNAAVPAEDLDPTVEDIARRLAAGPTQAYAATKLALGLGSIDALAMRLSHERDEQLELMQTRDHREAVQAFQQKRPPTFRGA